VELFHLDVKRLIILPNISKANTVGNSGEFKSVGINSQIEIYPEIFKYFVIDSGTEAGKYVCIVIIVSI